MNATFVAALGTHPLVAALGWTLLHFVWQGALIALVVFVCLRSLARVCPHRRYAVCGIGLMVLMLLPPITLFCVVQTPDATIESEIAMPASTTSSAPVATSSPSSLRSPRAADETETGVAAIAAADADALTKAGPEETPASLGVTQRVIAGVQQWLPWCVAGWCVGVSLFAIRLFVGLRRIRRWRREARPVTAHSQLRLLSDLQGRMNITRSVVLRESLASCGPAVIGWLRPAILIPAGMASGLTVAELEAILAHELAHVRRHDYLVNLLQTLAETVFFYHPAVWWLSGQLRVTREHCCDDLAVAVCGDRLTFAHALTRVEELCCGSSRLSVAAAGGSLADRIRRLVRPEPERSESRWPAGLLALGSVGGVLLTVLMSAGSAGADVDITDDAVQEFEIGGTSDAGVVDEADSSMESLVRVRLTAWRERDRGRVSGRGPSREAQIDMQYSGDVPYTFIPAPIAAQLNALELGRIDFGDRAPVRPRAFQSARRDPPVRPPVRSGNATKTEFSEGETRQPVPPAQQTLTVRELKQPAAGLRVVPYPNDRVWVPGHLKSLGFTKGTQHVFRIVRINRVDLGAGPQFGPANALVIEEAATVAGVLGRDWLETPRGENGESLWSGPDGTLHFVGAGQVGGQTDDATGQPGTVTVTSRRRVVPPTRVDRPGVKVLATHSYNMSRRASTGWVDVNGTRIPVDEGVTHAGVTIYSTLFHDIVAVDSSNKDVLWHIPWGKTMPMWQTISVVEMATGGSQQTLVELYATRSTTRQLIFRYHDLRSGKEVASGSGHQDLVVDSPVQSAERQRPQSAAQEDAADAKWGPATSERNLRLKLSLVDRQLREGSPVRLKLEIRNFGKDVATFDPQYYEPFRVLRVVEESGEADVFVGTTAQTEGGEVELAPGASRVLWEAVDAGDLFMLNEGTYRIHVASPRSRLRKWPASNELTVVVGAGKQTPFKRLFAELSRDLPPDWEVSSSYGGLFLSHVPTGLKRDVTTVQIWFTEKKLADDFELGSGAKAQTVDYIGQHALGHMNVAALPKAKQIWPTYVDYVKEAAVVVFDQRPAARPEKTKASSQKPWKAFGRVTDADGKPLPGVSVRAHTGAGSLRNTGEATTDKDGRYEMSFGPGIWSSTPGFVQAATISVHLAGHFEKNMHRQGDLVAAMQRPESEVGWGKTIDDLFLPDRPKEINFVMLPAARLRGMVVDDSGNPVEGLRVSLRGEEMPPSSSVVANTRTNAQGEYELTDLPTGYAFQLLVQPKKAEWPWLAWATAPMEFAPATGTGTSLKYRIDDRPVDFQCQQLNVRLQGEGAGWKGALKDGAARRLELKFDGLSSGDTVETTTAWIEAGTKE